MGRRWRQVDPARVCSAGADDDATPIGHHVLVRHLVFELECIDRVYCNAYVPQLQRELGVVGFIREHPGKPVASTAVLADPTEKFYAEVRRLAATSGAEIVEFAAGQRKDDVMRAVSRPDERF